MKVRIFNMTYHQTPWVLSRDEHQRPLETLSRHCSFFNFFAWHFASNPLPPCRPRDGFALGGWPKCFIVQHDQRRMNIETDDNTWNVTSKIYIHSPAKLIRCGHLIVFVRLYIIYIYIIFLSCCWWKKSCTTWDVYNPVYNGKKLPITWCRISRVNHILSNLHSSWDTLSISMSAETLWGHGDAATSIAAAVPWAFCSTCGFPAFQRRRGNAWQVRLYGLKWRCWILDFECFFVGDMCFDKSSLQTKITSR